MMRKTAVYRRSALFATTAIVVASACSSNSAPTANSVRSKLGAAGWIVKDGRGMTPIAGGKQLGWLDTHCSDGQAISIQLLEDPAHAKRELATIRSGTPTTKADPGFAGFTIGNALVFASPAGREPIAAKCRDVLQRIIAK